MKKSNSQVISNSAVLFLALFILAYLIISVLGLGRFPVFADEAIYIRWAQLFLDDPQRYAFFAMNDGKTPLFVWMLAALQPLLSNQLIAGRVVSVFGGVVQIIATWLILREFTQRRMTQFVGCLMVALLPFWFTYHRFAMMDGWLTAFLSLTFWAGLKTVRETSRRQLRWALLSGFFFGLALWTKLPALFFTPIFGILPLFSQRLGGKQISVSHYVDRKNWRMFLSLGVAVLVGGAIFLSLRLSPTFGQLFSRGQDFSYTLSEVLSGRWTESFKNLWRFTSYFGSYLTWPVLLVAVAGLFSAKERRSTAAFLLCALIFMLPFIVLGKVVHPRYLLPGALFLTIAACLNLETISLRCTQAIQQGKFIWAVTGLVIALLAGQVFTQSMFFAASFVLSPDVTPFVAQDRQQYLEEWSSGHGIAETVALISTLSKDHTVAVATEGRFGTLPDGLLLFFHNRNVDNLYIEGTGQYPVKTIPSFFSDKAKSFSQSLLVVNSHRMELMLPKENLLAEYCRPHEAPCLQVWDVSDVVKAAPSSQTP